MKRSIGLVAATSLIVWSAAADAQQQETWQEKLNQQLRNENVTRAVGSIAGALLGTQIGDGRGKLAAIAVGTLAGYWLGGKFSEKLNEADRVGIASTTERAIETGSTTTWSNPDTGTSTRVVVSDVQRTSGTAQNDARNPVLQKVPPIELVDSYFSPSVNLNVRGGPGTEYPVLHTLRKGTLVPVVGRVLNDDWFVISENGTAAGFAYAPMMDFSEMDTGAGGAVRDSMLAGRNAEHYEVATSTCRQVTQEVTLNDGASDSHRFQVCQQADGSWVEA
jgi:surface antigen